MDLGVLIQTISAAVIVAGIVGMVKQSNQVTRLATLVEALTNRVESLEKRGR